MNQTSQFRIRQFFNRLKTAGTLKVLLLIFLFTAGTSRGQQMVFPRAEWETATPESLGINSLRLNSAVEYLHPNFNSSQRDLVIIRNGRLVWESPGSHVRKEVASVTKSFTSTVLGLLIDDGQASLETRAADFVPSLDEDYPVVTFRHLATLTSGYQNVGTFGTPAYWDPAEPFFPPGEQFYYYGPAIDQLSNAMTQIAGEPIADLFRRRIADPIGMSGWYWEDSSPYDPPGSVAAVNPGRFGLEISARDAARFGHLFLNRGVWDGQQLISAEWVDEATRVQVSPTLPEYPANFGLGPGVYGYNWWVNGIKPDDIRLFSDAPASLFLASGARDNEIFVLPTWKMVVAKTADSDTTDLLRWNGFMKQIGSALLPDSGGTHLDVPPNAAYEVLDDTFDDLGDLVMNVSTQADAEIGEADLASSNYLSKLIVKFELPEPPEGQSMLQKASLGVRLVSAEGPPADPLSVLHSTTDNDLDLIAADYEDPSYVDTLADVVPIVEDSYDLLQYYDVDVTDLVLADYAADGTNPLSAFRLQLDGVSYLEDDQSHSYLLSMPGVAYRPQLLLTFGIPGDFDLDGDVDGRDFLMWQRGESPTPLSATNLASWQTNYGKGSAPLSFDSVVPEPITLALCCLAFGIVVVESFGTRKSRWENKS